ncbi:MAG: hypothetical protein OXG90_03715, partial [Gammaproteobacteria bacterium]|nr:hypothetical protein [Gammaproteobacteria bacterium]
TSWFNGMPQSIARGPARKPGSWEYFHSLVWEESPDTEEIRKHLLEIVSNPEEHRDKGYHFYTSPAYFKAIEQLIDWRDERVISALEELARHPGLDKVRPSIDGTIQLVRNRLGFDD